MQQHSSSTCIWSIYLSVDTIFQSLWFLSGFPLSAIFQLYHGDQFQWWKKPEYPERTTDHGQATGKLYHLRLRVECTLFCNLQSRARTHAVLVIGLYELLVGFVLLDLQFYVYVLQIVVCPFVLFLLAIVLSVLLRYTDSDYPFGIFKLFLNISSVHMLQMPTDMFVIITFRYFPHL